MKKIYLLLILCTFAAYQSFAQNYDYSLMFIGTNSGTGNYQFALIATPDFEQTVGAPTADMGAAIYIPSGYTLGNFAAGNSNLQFFEWANSQENSYDGNVTDLVQLLRTDIVANNFTHVADQPIELVLFDIISDMGNGNNPSTGVMTLAENTDPSVTNNFYESYININLQDGNGTQDYFGVHDPAGNSINFETLSTDDVSELVSSIQIFPNPASNMLFIESTTPIDRIELYDLLGKQIVSSSETRQIDLSHYQSGVYLLKLFANKKTITKKIVIK